MSDTAKVHLKKIFEAGVAAADAAGAVRRVVCPEGSRVRVGSVRLEVPEGCRVLVVGCGKASARMAAALEEGLGDRISEGWINVKPGHGPALRRVHVHEAGHPVPDQAGMRGAEEIVRIVRGAKEQDLVFCCISGGGSALLPLPVEGVSLEDKQSVTRQLLACGATIAEINAVRKHLSRVKGGHLARLAWPARVVGLMLSDVIGDAVDTIASGPTAPDPTTFADALAVLRKYGLEASVPKGVMHHLEEGAAGRRAETPKPGDPVFEKVVNLVVANNRAAVEACCARAEDLGYRPLVLTTALQGEAREVGAVLAAVGREVVASDRPVPAPACLVSAGETTVTLGGDGLGGRCQELALSAAIHLRGQAGVTVLAAGTDGTDGPTDAAGAFADGTTCGRAAALGLDPARFLKRNDSHHFFDRLGDLLRTGPTGTNVMDLYLVLAGAS